MKHFTKVGVAIAATVTCLLALSAPASAAVSSYKVQMVSGRISVGSTNFDTPGVGIATCPGNTTITGTINDAGGTDTITGNLSISSPFVLPIFGGNYILLATGTATGTDAGNYTGGATGTFNNMVFANVAFSIRSITSTTTCAFTTTSVCSGTATLTASGGTYDNDTVPLSTSEEIYVNATGSILTRGTPCTFPWSSVITVGKTLEVKDNPGDNYPQTSSPDANPDPGAIFHQIP